MAERLALHRENRKAEHARLAQRAVGLVAKQPAHAVPQHLLELLVNFRSGKVNLGQVDQRVEEQFIFFRRLPLHLLHLLLQRFEPTGQLEASAGRFFW